MISAIQSFVTSPALYNMTQSTVTQITTETCLKAVGRPAFILGDKDIDSQTKKFSSTKEFLYQMTCLGIYLAAVMPILRKGTFALARKMYKDEPVFKVFKNSGDFMKYYKMNDTEKAAKLVFCLLFVFVQNLVRFAKSNIKTPSPKRSSSVIRNPFF